MELNQLPKIKIKKKKRLGRGESSGKGKTSGRGAKGQKKREKVSAGFEGGQLPLYRRLPQRRGVGNPPKLKAITLRTERLNKLSEKETVTIKTLKKAGLLPKSAKNVKIKIVAGKPPTKALRVNLATSKKAKDLIVKAGGEVVYENTS